ARHRPSHRDRLQRRNSGELAAGIRHDRVHPPPCASGHAGMNGHDVSLPPPGTARPPRILVVDDEQSMRELLSIVLRREGYDVMLAETGQVAISMLEREPIDLLISDIKMPDL